LWLKDCIALVAEGRGAEGRGEEEYPFGIGNVEQNTPTQFGLRQLVHEPARLHDEQSPFLQEQQNRCNAKKTRVPEYRGT
jgi:hypothetical protein